MHRFCLLGLLAACLGCGGGGSSSGSLAATATHATVSLPTPSASPSPGATFSLPNFGGSQVVTLIQRSVPPTETTSANQTLSSSASNRDLPLQVQAAQRELCLRAARAPQGGPVSSRYQQLAQGATSTFFVGSNPTLTCQKMLAESQTVHCTVFAEVLAGGQTALTQAQALGLAQAWDSSNPFKPGAGIYDQVRAVFGHEWSSNPPGGADGDSKINLVCVSSASIGGSDVFGYFNASDELSPAQAPSSNQGEILYLNADKAVGDEFDLLATAAHEFQHMCDWNMKFGHDGLLDGTFEDTTLNEGQSVFCEDLLGYSLTASGGGNVFIFLVAQAYLQNTAQVGFFAFDGSPNAYGGGYTFYRYLNDRFGTAAVSAIATSPQVGLENVAGQLGLPFQQIFDDWTTANLCSPLASCPSSLQYLPGFSPTGSYSIRSLGAVTLPGVVPQVLGTLPSANSLSLGAWSAYYSQYSGGSGRTLELNVTPAPFSDASLVVQNPRGVFSQRQ